MPEAAIAYGVLQHTAACAVQRNHFDRLVHFSFGLLWAYPLREIGMRYFRATPAFASLAALAGVLACGAMFEIFEWLVAAIVDPQAGQAYLGTQGDEFDSQNDMALASLGGLLAPSLTVHLEPRRTRDKEPPLCT